MSYTEDLQTAFKSIGVTITRRDVEVITRIGADKFLALKGHNTNEESLSQIYIILFEMKQQQLTQPI